jgi:hypothetical protein
VVSVTDPYGRNLGFSDHSAHEAEWTPFQTHYFSDNLVAPRIVPGSLDL